MGTTKTKLEMGVLRVAAAMTVLVHVVCFVPDARHPDMKLDIALDTDLAEDAAVGCAGHCNGNCNIPKADLDQNCQLTKRMAKCLSNYIEPIGDSSHPKWNLLEGNHNGMCYIRKMSATRGKPGYVRSLRVGGTVSCPCSENGNPISKNVARMRILGQITAIHSAKWRMERCIAGNCLWQKLHSARMSFSAMLMTKCWQASCMKADVQVQLADSFGGGSCH